MEYIQQLFEQIFGTEWGAMLFVVAKNVTLIFAIVMPLLIGVAYLTYAERKIIAAMQIRVGPNRVTFFGISWLRGWGQPIADAVKAMMKEIVIPTGANKFLFILAPIITIAPALAAWAVVPFSAEMVLADINAGLLYILAMTSLGVYGVILAGWASNSKYAFLGAMRSAANIAHAQQLANGAALGASVSLEGQTITMVDGYPTADAAGIIAAAQISSDYVPSGTAATAGTTATFNLNPARTNCTVTYQAANAGGTPAVLSPVITATTNGC